MCIYGSKRGMAARRNPRTIDTEIQDILLGKKKKKPAIPHICWERCSGQQCSHTFSSQTSQDPTRPWIKILKSQRLWNTSTDVLMQTRYLGSCFHFVQQALITKYEAINFHLVFFIFLLCSTSCCSGIVLDTWTQIDLIWVYSLTILWFPFIAKCYGHNFIYSPALFNKHYLSLRQSWLFMKFWPLSFIRVILLKEK